MSEIYQYAIKNVFDFSAMGMSCWHLDRPGLKKSFLQEEKSFL